MRKKVVKSKILIIFKNVPERLKNPVLVEVDTEHTQVIC